MPPWQNLVAARTGAPTPLNTAGLCLLSLDGGGVRGLATLYTLNGVMSMLNDLRENEGLQYVKPCQVFDLIGGTSTGGLIAIMLGRLEMTVEECITAYIEIMKVAYIEPSHWLPVGWTGGEVKTRFDSEKLRDAIEQMISSRGISLEERLNNDKDQGCRTFVCTTVKGTQGITRLRNYSVPDEDHIPATICEAVLATCAATTCFDPVSIGARQFVDGVQGAINPVEEVEGEAVTIWSPEKGDLRPLVKCFLSIGPGDPGEKILEDSTLGFLSKTVVRITREAEETHKRFVARFAKHLDNYRFFRLNVDDGLQDIGLPEHRKPREVKLEVIGYFGLEIRMFQKLDCAVNLKQKLKKTKKDFASIVKEDRRRYILQNCAGRRQVCYVPSPKNRDFVGRKDELTKLKKKLLVDQECQKMSITGSGGTGKTQVALQFAYAVMEAWPECSVIWLPAASMESFEQACTKLVQALHIPQTTSEKANSVHDAKELVKRYFSAAGPGQRWLLVLDNADDRDIVLGIGPSNGIVDYLPESEQGMIVYTTSIRDMAVSMTGTDILDLGPMNRQDAEDLLQKSLTNKSLINDSAAMAELSDELAGLPIAIRLATAYLNMNKTLSIVEYLRLLRNTEQDFVGIMNEQFHNDTRYEGSGSPFATTWAVSFSQIRERDEVAADLLAFMVCIEWGAIPHSLLPREQSEARLQEAIDTLCGYSFLESRQENHDDQQEKAQTEKGEKAYYDVHQLVDLATRVWLTRHGKLAEVAVKALQHITAVFPPVDDENRTLWRAYLPHAMHMVKTTQGSDPEMQSGLAPCVGMCLQLDDRIKEAVTWLEECCRWKCNLAEDDPMRLLAEYALGRTYIQSRQISRAVGFLEPVVHSGEKRLEKDDIELLTAQYFLAIAYQADSEAEKAMAVLKHVVEVMTQTYPGDEPVRVHAEELLQQGYEEKVQEEWNFVEPVETVQRAFTFEFVG